MEKWLYVMMIKKGKTYNKVTKAVITRHVENLRKLDAEGKIELCGRLRAIRALRGWLSFGQKAMRRQRLCASRSRL